MKSVSNSALVAAVAVCVGSAAAISVAAPHYRNSPIATGTPPSGYRDWKLISVAHEEGNLNDLRAILGNDNAIKTYRTGKSPFPDGTIIARLAWDYVPSEENNKAFGRRQSFVAGHPTNVQFMIKDSQKYSSTGGWGFSQFSDGKSKDIRVQECFSCHVPAKARDFIFTRYSP
jgi:Cytochrome P460